MHMSLIGCTKQPKCMTLKTMLACSFDFDPYLKEFSDAILCCNMIDYELYGF